MKLARHRKARTLAITDATLCEVAKLAQITLYYSSNSPAYVRSHAACCRSSRRSRTGSTAGTPRSTPTGSKPSA